MLHTVFPGGLLIFNTRVPLAKVLAQQMDFRRQADASAKLQDKLHKLPLTLT